jgi:choice-of-anchor B domain-containing protein
MKNLFISLLIVSTGVLVGQTYQSQNISLLSVISPNTTTNTSVNKYSGCWGWYQASKNKEYAISGGSNGTYFIDVTNPLVPVLKDFVPSKSLCTWREMKTFDHYCYIVSDVCQPNSFQIVDLQYLPDSVHVIHDDTTLFTLGHTIWIDKDKMYVASTQFNASSSSPMTVWSLANPTMPVLLRRVEQDIPSITEVHDMYFRNDTGFVSAGWLGLRMVKFNSATNTFSQTGSYNGYPEAGYNHSSMLTQDGKHLIFCDEVPESKPIHCVNVQNPANVQPVVKWHPRPKTTPHNPFLIGNQWAIVSCYQDGLYLYDISNPNNIKQKGFFDTYYQGGYNINAPLASDYGQNPYSGNWGAYPYLPSKVIIANDMQNGVFLLDATVAYTTNTAVSVGIQTSSFENGWFVYPNPADDNLTIEIRNESRAVFQLRNAIGQLVNERIVEGYSFEEIDLHDLPNGTYFISMNVNNIVEHRKLIISH